MKHCRMYIMMAILMGALLQVNAQKAQPYFNIDEMPDMLKFLPAPPDTTSEAFSHDVMRYFWGKQMWWDTRKDVK